jgi:hypothetical protein
MDNLIKDKGRIKWTAMITLQQPGKINTIRSRAETKEAFSADIDMLIHEAMEYNWKLEYKLISAESIHSLYGTTVFIDYIKKELRIKDIEHYIHYVPFGNLLAAKRAE